MSRYFSALTLTLILFLSACGSQTSTVNQEALNPTPTPTPVSNSTNPSWWFFIRNTQGTWDAAQVGIDGYIVQDGDVLGFAFTGYDLENFTPLRTPPMVDLDKIADKSDPAAAEGTQVGIVISPDSDSFSTYFVSDLSASITALAALQDTGIPLTLHTSSYGTALCAIQGTGYPEENCLGSAN